MRMVRITQNCYIREMRYSAIYKKGWEEREREREGEADKPTHRQRSTLSLRSSCAWRLSAAEKRVSISHEPFEIKTPREKYYAKKDHIQEISLMGAQ